MREVEELRPLTAGRLLRIRREAERGGWDEAERGLRCNAQVLAESCFTGGEAVFADGEAVLEELEGLDVSQIHIPLGSLVDLDILWGLGPELKVHAMTVGTVEGEFESSFSSAGVNQTLHRIELVLHIPLTLMLPAGAVETNCDTRLCVAETVIVGQVPQFYLAS